MVQNLNPDFMFILEKKVKKHLRGLGSKQIAVVDFGGAELCVLKSLLSLDYEIISKENFDSFVLGNVSLEYDLILLPLSSDRASLIFFEDVFSGKIPRAYGQGKIHGVDFVNPLIGVSLLDCENYCKRKGIAFEKADMASERAKSFILGVKEINPRLVYSAASTIKNLSEILNR